MQKGFSLIELIVVVTIIGLLAAVAAPSYRTYQDRANNARLSRVMDKYLTDFKIARDRGVTLADPALSELNGTPISAVYYGNPIISSIGTGSNYVNFNLRPYNSPGGLPFIAGYVIATYGASQQNGIYSWTCTLYMPNNPLSYGGTLTREQTRATYFPDCKCTADSSAPASTCP